MNPEDKLIGEDKTWKTKPKFWSWVRGGLRRALWNTHPSKIDLIKEKRFKAPLGVNDKEVWCCTCTMCGDVKRQTECQVDHIVPAGSLKSVKDLEPFITRLAFISPEDLRVVCKWCNSVLSYADRQGISFEEALEKKLKLKNKK